MQYMIAWRIPPANYKETVEAFLDSGAPVPNGLSTVGRWHTTGSATGWHLVEGSEAALAEHVATWAGLIELDVSPVINDETAAASLSKAFGK